MAGGKLPGAPKTGGRVKGSLNKSTVNQMMSMNEAFKEIASELTRAEVDNISPKDVLLRIMRAAFNAGNINLAMAAAEKASPYCHARLANTTMEATIKRAPSDFSDAELLALAGRVSADEEDDVEPAKRPIVN